MACPRSSAGCQAAPAQPDSPQSWCDRPAEPVPAPAGGRALWPVWLGLGLLLLSALGSIAWRPAGLADSDTPHSLVEVSQIQQARQLKTPVVDSPAALVADAESGRVLFERNADKKLAPASTTKVLTALIVLERGNLAERVTVEASDLVGITRLDSQMGLRVGDTLTVQDLLWGLLLPSGNDAAQVLARVVGGSPPGFVQLMNERAAQIGARNTHFTNPHGRGDPEHYTTARDLMLLTREALKQPLFREIVATRRHTVEFSRTLNLANTNDLLGLLQGADGVKTGTTDDDTYCLVASQTRDGHQAIAVVLDAVDNDTRLSDSKTLLTYFFTATRWLVFTPPPWLPWLAADPSPPVLIEPWLAPSVVPQVERAANGAAVVRYRLGQQVLAETLLRG